MKIGENDKRNILEAVADIGRASGLEAAAKVLLALADHKRRVVGTGELKAAAASLQECAAALRAKREDELKLYQLILNN